MEKEHEYRLNESSTKRCAEVFNSYAERFKLPKNFLEFKTDFEKLYGDTLSNGHYSSWEVQILFKTYIIDYIPVVYEEAERSTISLEKAAAGIANSLIPKAEALGESIKKTVDVAKQEVERVAVTIEDLRQVKDILDKQPLKKLDELLLDEEKMLSVLRAKELHAQGFSYVKIGKELGVSDKTAKKYVES